MNVSERKIGVLSPDANVVLINDSKNEISVIRYDARLNAMWINTTDVNIAYVVAEKFLKSIETSEHIFEVGICEIWKKDKTLIKAEYRTKIRPCSETN